MATTKRVLVADDNKDAADSLAVLLEWLGHEVVACYDGGQAVALAAAFKPDLIVLDINMPVMDGYSAARTIRRSEGDRVLLAAITGAVGWETPTKAVEAGFDAFFGKPVDSRDLEALLYRIQKGDYEGVSE